MSTSLKILIALTGANITKEDLSNECGFIDAYTDDINKPYLDHHIFLMYDYDANNYKKQKTYRKLQKIGTISKYTINGKMYKICAIPYINTFDIKSLKCGYLALSKKGKEQISETWGGSEKDVNEYLFGEKTKIEIPNNILDEIDYIETPKFAYVA